MRLGYALTRVGWFPHQHRASIARVEPGSTPFHGPLDKASGECLARCQRLIDDLVETPPPTPSLDYVAWPRAPDGRFLLRWASDSRPAEQSFTDTSSLTPDKRRIIWRTIVSEIGSTWARADRQGRSSGRVFLGPKDRFLYWPKHLNAALADAPVTFGRILDLFTVLATAGVKIDIKSAYRAIELHDDDALYHCAVVDTVWVCFTRLSFGMGQSPAMFSTALATTIARFQGSLPATEAAISQWVDDSGLVGRTIPGAVIAAEGLLLAFMRDRWWAAVAKVFLWPAVRLLYTGFLLDFANRAIRIDPAKAAKCIALLASIRRPTDVAIAASASSTAPLTQPTGSSTDPTRLDPTADRCTVLTSLAASPGVRVACLGELSPSDAPPRPIHVLRNVASPPLPSSFTVSTETTFASLQHAAHHLLPCSTAAAHAGQPLLVITGTADPTPIVAAAVAGAAAVVIITSPPPTDPTVPVQWWHPSARIPDRLASPRINPSALPSTPSDVRRPAQQGDRLDLEPSEWNALRSVVGMMSWWQTALPFIAPWRALLAALPLTARWTALTAAAFDAVFALVHVVQDWIWSVDPPTRTLHIVTDASATGWGAVITGGDGKPVFLCGALSPEEAMASSGFRETVAVVAAVRAAMADPRIPPFDGVSVTVDSTVLCGAAAGRPGPGMAVALCTLSAWAIQGLRVAFTWQSRSSVTHQAPDALSSATAVSAPWTLRDAVREDIAADTGPRHIDLTAYRGHDARIAPAYATPSLDAAADRRRVLRALGGGGDGDAAAGVGATAAGGAASLTLGQRHGWVGVTADVAPSAAESAFAHPLWSDLGLIAAWQRDHPDADLVVVAPASSPATRRTWWGAHLETLCDAAAWSAPLPSNATVPPNPGATRDPRPLRVLWFGRNARAFNGSARLGTPARLAWVRGGRNPGDGPGAADVRADRRRRIAATIAGGGLQAPRRAPPAAPRSTPSLRRDPRVIAPATDDAQQRRARLAAAAGRGRSRTSAAPDATTGQHHATAAAARTDATAPPPTKARRVATSAAAQAVAAAAKAPAVAPPAVVTLGGWLLALRDFIASRNSGVRDDDVPDALQPFVAIARATVRLKAVAGSSRTVRAPRYLFQLVVALGVGGAPFGAATVDAVAVTYAIRRLDAEPPLGWRRVEHAATVKSDLSSVSAMSGRMGVGVAPVCGTLVAQYLNARGAGDRSEHSHAWPIHISDLLKVEPPYSSPKWQLWAACIVLAFFCLRPGVLRHLTRAMFIGWRKGWILIWRYVSKTTAGDILDPELRSAVERVAAARNAVLTRVFERLPAKGPLFPEATVSNLDTFIKESFPQAPKGFRLCTYGIRVAADLEAVELGVPVDLTNALFWWRRLTVSSRLYYGGLSIHRMFLFSEARTRLTFVHFFAGRYDARIAGGPRPDFKAVPAGSLPPLPATTAVELEAAWAAEASTVADERVGRALKVAHPQAWQALPADAPPAEADAQWPAGDDEASDTMSVDCGGCGSHLDRTTPGTACATRTCKYVLGECCHRLSSVGILCPAHDPASASKAAAGKGKRRQAGRK